MSATLEERIQRLEDIEAIRRLKHRYMAYADAGYDADRIVTLMTPDAVWDGGEAFGRQEGAEAFGNMVREVGKQISFAAHLALNEIIDVDGDTARGQWWLLMPCTALNDAGQDEARWIFATYDDRLVKRDGRWPLRPHGVRREDLLRPQGRLGGSVTGLSIESELLRRSRHVARTNRAQGVGIRPLGDNQLVAVLEIHPAPGIGVEVPREAQRGLGRDAAATAHDFVDPRRRNADGLRERRGREPEWLHEVVLQTPRPGEPAPVESCRYLRPPSRLKRRSRRSAGCSGVRRGPA